MSRQNRSRERARTVLFMFVTTFVCISAVAALHLATREIVARNQALDERRAVLDAAGVGEGITTPLHITEAYDRLVREATNAAGAIYFVVSDPAGGLAPRGYVFRRQGPGLWGTITAMVGLESDFETLTGIVFTEQNETPGLGARITESWFTESLRGKRPPLKRVAEDAASLAVNEMHAITGATITTATVRDILARLIAEAKQGGLVGTGVRQEEGSRP